MDIDEYQAKYGKPVFGSKSVRPVYGTQKPGKKKPPVEVKRGQLPKTYTDTHLQPGQQFNPGATGPNAVAAKNNGSNVWGGPLSGAPPAPPVASPYNASPLPTIDPNKDYLKDAGYLSSVGALDEALRNFRTQQKTEAQRYDLDYKKALQDLGWEDTDPGKAVKMGWDTEDLLTASGKSYQGNTNDFAARGMIQSQAYVDALDLWSRSLGDQKADMGTSRSNFRADQKQAKTEYGTQYSTAKKTAATDAIARLAAQLGITL